MKPVTSKALTPKPLTGRKVLAIALTSFAVILTPNLILAYMASATFSGLIVQNSYVASQQFNDRTRAQEALGWTLAVRHDGTALQLDFADAGGTAVRPATLAVTVGRPTSQATDRDLALHPTPTGFVGPVALEPGNWLVIVDAEAADGTRWKQRHTVFVGGAS